VSSHSEELKWFDSTVYVAKRLQRDIQSVSRRIKPTRPDLHVSYFLFSKELKSLGAIRLLWASNFFQDALVLSRSIFEACVLDMYIRTNRAALTERYLAAARHSMSVGMVRSMKNRRGRLRRGWKGAAARYGRARKASPYEFDEPRGWSGKSLREIVRLLEEKKGAEGLWAAYEFFYGLGSAVAH